MAKTSLLLNHVGSWLPLMFPVIPCLAFAHRCQGAQRVALAGKLLPTTALISTWGDEYLEASSSLCHEGGFSSEPVSNAFDQLWAT